MQSLLTCSKNEERWKAQEDTDGEKTPILHSKILILLPDIPSICFDEFSEKFILPENLRK